MKVHLIMFRERVGYGIQVEGVPAVEITEKPEAKSIFKPSELTDNTLEPEMRVRIMIEQTIRNRTTAATVKNPTSSRSKTSKQLLTLYEIVRLLSVVYPRASDCCLRD